MPLKPVFTFSLPTEVVHTIPVLGEDTFVEVLGMRDDPAFEWQLVTPQGVTMHSDCAYGSPEAALRDGLVAALGPVELARVVRIDQGRFVRVVHEPGHLPMTEGHWRAYLTNVQGTPA